MVNKLKSSPLVSVVMNCYNSEKFLKEAIDSVYHQKYKNWEIIFWDNQSKDNSAEIAKSCDNRLKYYYADKHTSLGMARKHAVNLCNGELIAFLDCDDIWMPEKLLLQVEKITSGNFSMCYGGCTDIDENGNHLRSIVPKYSDGFMFENLLYQWDINMPSILVRKADLNRLNLNFDENIYASEEYCLFMQLAVTTQFCTIDKPIVKWRIRSNSLTSQQISKIAHERRYTLDKIIKNHKDIRLKYPNAFNEAYARSYYYDATYYMSINNKKKARKCMQSIKDIDYKYKILFYILYLPSFVWKFITSEKIKRKYLAFIFNISKYYE